MSRAYDNAADARFPSGRRNLIINGGFQVWQRGTSFSGDEYTADRWYAGLSGATATISQQSFTVGQTDVPGEPEYYLRFNVTGANDNVKIQQPIEDVRTAAGQTVTLSFWIKSTSAPTSLTPRFQQNFGSGGSSAVNTDGTTITGITSSWQKIERQVTIPSISGKTIGSSSYFLLQLFNPNNETFDFDIASVQIETGTIATPFEHRSYGEELALCQRYCVLLTNDDDTSEAMPIGARGFNTDQIECDVYFPAEMRTLPTLSQLGSGTNWRARYSNFNVDWTSFTWWTNSSRRGGLLYNGSLSGVTIGNCYRLERLTSGAYLIFDAEL